MSTRHWPQGDSIARGLCQAAFCRILPCVRCLRQKARISDREIQLIEMFRFVGVSRSKLLVIFRYYGAFDGELQATRLAWVCMLNVSLLSSCLAPDLPGLPVVPTVSQVILQPCCSAPYSTSEFFFFFSLHSPYLPGIHSIYIQRAGCSFFFYCYGGGNFSRLCQKFPLGFRSGICCVCLYTSRSFWEKKTLLETSGCL